MSNGIERCPHCPAAQLVARTNLNGSVYLECGDCGYVEGVQRHLDPNPTRYTVRVDEDGRKHKRVLTSKAHWQTAYRGRVVKPIDPEVHEQRRKQHVARITASRKRRRDAQRQAALEKWRDSA